MKAIRIIAILSLIAVCFSSGVFAQHEKIPKNPFRFTDAVTATITLSTLVVRTLGFHRYEFFGFDDVGGEVVAVDAARI